MLFKEEIANKELSKMEKIRIKNDQKAAEPVCVRVLVVLIKFMNRLKKQ